MAFGNTIGVAIVDYVQKTNVMVVFNYELSGTLVIRMSSKLKKINIVQVQDL